MPKTVDSVDTGSLQSDTSSQSQLSEMIDAGRSFSGNERNCCFLNTGEGSFANVSGGSGLDFPDDGRAIATTDWDHDGDLDLWISNRNGPRVRLMRNDTESENHFVSVLLKGNGRTVNRDAIGARVEVRADEKKGSLQQIQTLRAGQGFLSQSSKWMHFGLGSETTTVSMVIRWPDGSTKKLQGIEAGRRYVINQNKPDPLPAPLRKEPVKLSPSVSQQFNPSDIARVPAVTLLQGPKLNLKRKDGTKAQLDQRKSLLINLWATWCAPCLQELTHLRDQADRLRESGVDVIAFNVDNVSGQETDPTKAPQTLKKIGFPFPSTNATEPFVELLQRLHNQIVGLNEPLPVPSSFLIDPKGRVSVIYKGPLEVDQLIADLKHSSGKLEDRILRSAQVKGTTIQHPQAKLRALAHESSIHSRHGRNWQLTGDLDGAIYHYTVALKLNPKSKNAASQLAFCHFAYAAKLNSNGNQGTAVVHYREGLKSQPTNRTAINNLAWILATSPKKNIRNPQEALRIADQLNKDTGNKIPMVLDTLAAALASTEEFQAAIAAAERAISFSKTAAQQKLVPLLKDRLKLYKTGNTYTEIKREKTE